jgi:hypothetical protein
MCADERAAGGELERALSEAEAYASKVASFSIQFSNLSKSDADVSSCFGDLPVGVGVESTLD